MYHTYKEVWDVEIQLRKEHDVLNDVMEISNLAKIGWKGQHII